jgi:hypothetical protein
MAKPVLNERTIAEYMKVNKCDRDEAIDLIKYDIAVESDEATEYDLTAEQAENVKKMMRKTDHAKAEGKVQRERKPNELKEALIATLADYLENECEFDLSGEVTYCGAVEVTNKSRMIAFEVNDKRFELTLVEKRPPKAK